MKQAQALKILTSGENVFLTGSAGTGKTFLLNEFIKYLRKEKIKVGITASTGIASTHLNGSTIHSWSGIGISKDFNSLSIKRLLKKKNPKLKEIKETKVLIIDEISMLDATRLDLIDRVCKEIKDPFLPFGGIQVVFCGDFFQLPPIDDNNEERSQFAYNALSWDKAKLKICYLEKQFRQNDKNFSKILNNIRGNKADENTIDKLKERLNKNIYGCDKVTRIYSHNKNVDAINEFELSKIKKKEVTYNMSFRGPEKLVNSLKKNCLAPEALKLKEGAIVMFLKNNPKEGYVNGTMGMVVGFEEKWPIVKTVKGKHIAVSTAKWNIEKDEEVLASVEQIPLKLAWAITIHKSQGMSLDVAEIDLSNSFEYGMGYVALSRVKTLDGIKLLGINKSALLVNEDVVKKDIEFVNLSKQAEKL